VLSPRWRKVVRDLRSNVLRSVLVVVSIATGVFAVGTIAGASAMLEDDLASTYAASSPASATIFSEPFGNDLLDAVRGLDGVDVVEGRSGGTVRVLDRPEPRDLELTAIPDFDRQALDVVTPESGAWPPAAGELLLERSGIALVGARVGDTVRVEGGDGDVHTLRVAGTSHEVGIAPAFISGTPTGHVTVETLESLGFPPELSLLRVRTTDPGNRALAEVVAVDARERIERSGRAVFGTFIPEPGRHPAQDVIASVLLILGALGFLSLLVSGFLVANTISAILSQQVRQIGVMKAVGARTSQVAGLYVVTVLVFAVLALAVGIPLGMAGAWGLTSFTASLINFDPTGPRLPAEVLALQLGVGLLVPLAAAAVPVLGGARITIRQALASYGLGGDTFGRSRVDRALERIRGLPRPLALSLRNTFRRKGRLVLTLSALVLGGAVFASVFSVRSSLLATMDEALRYFNYDVDVQLTAPHRSEAIVRTALGVPGVVKAESWARTRGRLVREDGSESRAFGILGPPADSELLVPNVLSGRWLLPGDENAVVVNTALLDEEAAVAVGDEITLTVEGRESRWHVVGVVQAVTQGRYAYVNRPWFQREMVSVGRTESVQVVTVDHDAATQARVAAALEERLEARGMGVASTLTFASIRETNENQFNVLVAFLALMAVLLGVVGGLGLAGTMSINVLERAREIGVLRAVGATDRAVLGIVVGEGLIIGVLSWLLAVALSVPIGKLMSDAVGALFVDEPLAFRVSAAGAAAWLAVVAALAIAASLLPAWRATRLSVREVLAYE
jgi:putative ABC transport system permease protein